MTPNQTQRIGQKYSTYMHYSTLNPKFLSVSLYDQLLSRYYTFKDFPIGFHVKISKCCKICNFCRLLKRLYSLVTALFIIRFGSYRIKTVEGVISCLKFPAIYGPVLTKISKCHKIFNFLEITKTFITFHFSITTLFIIKFGSDWMKIVEVAQHLKIENFDKRKHGLEIYNLVDRELPSKFDLDSRNLSLRTDRRMTDASAMTVARLLTKSSRVNSVCKWLYFVS